MKKYFLSKSEDALLVMDTDSKTIKHFNLISIDVSNPTNGTVVMEFDGLNFRKTNEDPSSIKVKKQKRKKSNKQGGVVRL